MARREQVPQTRGALLRLQRRARRSILDPSRGAEPNFGLLSGYGQPIRNTALKFHP